MTSITSQETHRAHPSHVPSQMERHLQSLDFDKVGNLLLGCSSLTTRYWTGSLWYFSNPSDAPSISKCVTGLEIENGLFEAIFLREDGKQILAGLDNGALEVFQLAKSDGSEALCIERTQTFHEHNDLITGMAKTCDNASVVTASYDRSIVRLDLPTFSKQQELSNIHDNIVTSLDTSKKDPSQCFTSSADGRAAIWDLRKGECCQVLFEDTEAYPTSVQSVPDQEFLVVVGSLEGGIHLCDTRNPLNPLFAHNLARQQRVHKLTFSPKRPTLLSVAYDSKDLTVLQVTADTGFKEMLVEDERHTDYIRGMAWHPKENSLWTCGWDKQVCQRQI